MKVTAKTSKNPTPVSAEVYIPETLEDLVEYFGEDVVKGAATGAIVIAAQAAMRRLIDKATPTHDIAKAMENWKPGVRAVAKANAFEKATAAVSKLSAEERRQLLAELTAGE